MFFNRLFLFFSLLIFACIPSVQAQIPAKTSNPAISSPSKPNPPIQLSKADPIKDTPPVIDTSPVMLAGLVKTAEYPIDLPVILKLVEQQNLDIANFREGFRIARTQFYESVAPILPDITGTLNINQLKGGLQVFSGTPVTVNRKIFQPQLAANWLIYPGGTTIFQALAAKRLEGVSKYALLETEQQQLAAAAIDYYNLLSSQAQVQNALQSLKEDKEQVSIAEARLRVGVGVKLDVVRAKNVVAQQEATLIQAKAQVNEVEQDLLNRLNLDTTIHLITHEPLNQKHILVPENTQIQSLIQQTFNHNPALQQVRMEIKANRANMYGAISLLVPSVNLEYYVNRSGPNINNTVVSHYRGLLVTANLLQSMGLAVPLQIREQAQRVKQSQIQEKSAIRSIEQQSVDAYLDSQSAASTIIYAMQQVGYAEESYRLAVGRYKAGVGVMLDVLDAQTQLNNARTTLTQDVANYNDAQVRLVQALGIASPQSLTQGISKFNIPTKP